MMLSILLMSWIQISFCATFHSEQHRTGTEGATRKKYSRSTRLYDFLHYGMCTVLRTMGNHGPTTTQLCCEAKIHIFVLKSLQAQGLWPILDPIIHDIYANIKYISPNCISIPILNGIYCIESFLYTPIPKPT